MSMDRLIGALVGAGGTACNTRLHRRINPILRSFDLQWQVQCVANVVKLLNFNLSADR
jgi:hypothetical protein